MTATEKKHASALVSEAELEELKRRATKAGLTVSNYIRKRLGFPPLRKGAPLGNKFAMKKKKASKTARPRE